MCARRGYDSTWLLLRPTAHSSLGVHSPWTRTVPELCADESQAKCPPLLCTHRTLHATKCSWHRSSVALSMSWHEHRSTYSAGMRKEQDPPTMGRRRQRSKSWGGSQLHASEQRSGAQASAVRAWRCTRACDLVRSRACSRSPSHPRPLPGFIVSLGACASPHSVVPSDSVHPRQQRHVA